MRTQINPHRSKGTTYSENNAAPSNGKFKAVPVEVVSILGTASSQTHPKNTGMKRVNLPPAGSAPLLVNAIVEEEALITELISASHAGDSKHVLALSCRIAALRATQEAVADKLLQRC